MSTGPTRRSSLVSPIGSFALAGLIACGGPEPAWDPADPPRANVVVIVADDLGTDKVAAYAEHPAPPRTPRLDALAAEGVLFRNAYTYPSCSPSRAAMLTGRHPRHYGIVHWIRPWSDHWQLDERAYTVPDLLDERDSWHTSFAGKWHLADFNEPDVALHPTNHGWDWYAGSLANLTNSIQTTDRFKGYEFWEKVRDGGLSWTETYPTTDTVDDAIARLSVMPEPWVLWVSLNAPHEPEHEPPAELITEFDTINPVNSAIEAMDHEVGRLLDALPDDTAVVFIGDNGTAGRAVTEPWDAEKAKTTVFEGGVNVPLIVAGPWVRKPGESAALVHATDLFATLGDNAGVDPAVLPDPIDGQSWLPLLDDLKAPGRDVAIAAYELSNGPGPWRGCAMAREERYKVIRCNHGTDLLYDLKGRTDDGKQIVEPSGAERRAQKRLGKALDAWEEASGGTYER